MMPKTSRPLFAIYLVMSLVLLCLCSLSVLAQQEFSQYDRGTPPPHTAGVSQLGSYLSTDLGAINLSNGALNFKIPLGNVGGRGFWLPLTLNYTSKVWSTATGNEYIVMACPGCQESGVYDPIPLMAFYDNAYVFGWLAPGWSVGAAPGLLARGIGLLNMSNGSSNIGYGYIVTKLTFVLPDRGEVQLRDDLTEGQPLGSHLDSIGHYTQDGYRGRRWHATDGSGTIFVSDQDNGVSLGNLTGTVITADGTRYRFERPDPNAPLIGGAGGTTTAHCTSITDRNGNKVQISYPGNRNVQYTDQVGRTTTVTYDTTDPATGQPLALLVDFPSYGGTHQYIKIKAGIMSQNYRSDILVDLPVVNGLLDRNPTLNPPPGWVTSYTPLFPMADGSVTDRIDDKSVVTEIVLPDNRSLRFKYNQFGEVAEVQTPTGGKVQYDYSTVLTLPSGNSYGPEIFADYDTVDGHRAIELWDIDRAVGARRTYPGGSTLEGSWTYSYSATFNQSTGITTNGITTVKAYSASNALLSDQRHLFLTAQRYSETSPPPPTTGPTGTGYTLWSTGTEWRTETRNAAGSVLAAAEKDWAQRVPTGWSWQQQQQQLENDNRVSEERHYLDDGSMAKVDT